MEIKQLLNKTKQAAKLLRLLKSEQRAQILRDLSLLLIENKNQILAENQKDLNLMDINDSKYDRLKLTDDRIQNLAASLISVSNLPDPSYKLIEKFEKSNGLLVEKISVPMGVIGVIFESRPNVTIDVAAICIMSGNAAVLKGGKEAVYSNAVLVSLIHKALISNNLSADTVLLYPADRQYLNELLQAKDYIDLLIPRGSQALIDHVRTHATIPCIETGAGVCHTYVEASANISMAANIIINAKASRPSVCNSLDSAILDVHICHKIFPLLIPGLRKYNIEVFADDTAYAYLEAMGYDNIQHATHESFRTEWLGLKMNIKVVNNHEEAFLHLENYSSKHSEAIITENLELANRFLTEVDAASVYHNASTRFTDGEEFNLGAEIGISTQKLHARGPFALEKLVTEKWIVKGNGQVRW